MLALTPRTAILGLIAAGVLLRAMLAAYAPTPYGYVWDVYQDGVRVLYRTGALPAAPDCWQCYHPPLYYLVGLPFYAAGRLLDGGADDRRALLFLNLLPLLCAVVTTYFGYRLLRLYRFHGWTLATGVGLLLSFPAFFISSYSAEADAVLTAILSAFIYYLAREGFRRTGNVRAAVRLGILAGLAVATKYSGLVAPISAVVLYGFRAVVGPWRGEALRDAAIVILACSAIGGWKYVDNMRVHGTPLFANGSAAEGFAVGGKRFPTRYEFTTFRLDEVLALTGRGAPGGSLTTQPVYRSVPSTLHALAWSDMSFFSVPGRHGESTLRYRKRIPTPLIATVLVLGIVADLLAAIGLTATIRHRSMWPLAMVVVLTAGAYLWWVLAQEFWALKTKYLLFLLPTFVVYVLYGWRSIASRSPAAGRVIAALLISLVAAAHLYAWAFAAGRL